MELLVLLSLCLLTFIGKTFGDDFVKITIKEDEDVILNCSFGTDITGHRIEWKKDDKEDDKDVFYFDFRKEDPTVEDPKFKDRVSRISKDLKSGDASVKIKGAKVSDSGKYTCLHINKPGKAPGPEDQRLIELTVGTCPQPIIKALENTDGGRQVECKAVGAFPQPTMELKNDANVTFKPEVYVSQNGNYFDITLLAVVTEEGFYHCVLTQEDICHQIFSEKNRVVMPSDEIAGQLKTVVIIAIVLAIVAAVFVIVAVVLAAALIHIYKKNTRRNTVPSASPEEENLSRGHR